MKAKKQLHLLGNDTVVIGERSYRNVFPVSFARCKRLAKERGKPISVLSRSYLIEREKSPLEKRVEVLEQELREARNELNDIPRNVPIIFVSCGECGYSEIVDLNMDDPDANWYEGDWRKHEDNVVCVDCYNDILFDNGYDPRSEALTAAQRNVGATL